jgi:type IV secretion/conjugal transfer VirB4 family ATPase
VFRLDRIFKAYRETGAMNEQINLFGFVSNEVFLTKTGDAGVVLAVKGVDYECLDAATVDTLTKRFEAALRLFDENCRVYQYLFKENKEKIPFKTHADPVVNTAIRNRIQYLESKAEHLYSLKLYYVVLFEGFRYKPASLQALFTSKGGNKPTLSDFLSLVSTPKQVFLIDTQIRKAQDALLLKVHSFVQHVNDFLEVEIMPKQEAFRVLKKVLNFDPVKTELARLKHDTFLDYYLPESHLECHRNHLRLDDHYVRVLTLKEPSAYSFPLIFRRLLGVEANYFVVTEWKKEDPGKSRRTIQSRRRHFHNTKKSFMSQVSVSDGPPAEGLVDDSKAAQVQELGESIKELELKGNYFGHFSLTAVIYDRDEAKMNRACAEFSKVFSVTDAQLYEEKYNLLNAFLAAVPGNYAFNLRNLLITNANYADYSFLFTLHCGEPVNRHLRQEYLAVLETTHQTPYFLNLHHRDVAHTIILGRTGSGKSFLLNFLITNLQKYDPLTFILDLGGSFESLTKLFKGSYAKLGVRSDEFTINPFALPPTKANLDFLFVFLKVLLEGSPQDQLSPEEERDLFQQIENLYAVDAHLRTLSVLANILPKHLANQLHKWTAAGQFGILFDNVEDTITFSRFQCFDFQAMREYPQLLEPLLFYLLHRANSLIANPETTQVFKAFLIDEAWIFFKNPSIKSYIVQALKTWRKHNAAMILSTQSLDELRKSDILDVVVESCPTKIFLANPDMDRELYQGQFHLNETEIELVSTLRPKQQLLIKTPDYAKVANLNVDAKSYWLYTNDPFDNQKRREAFEAYGFEKGLEVLAGEHS